MILNLKCPLVFKFKCALYNTLVTCFSIYTYGVHRSTPFHGTWSSNCNNQIYCYIKSTLVNNTIIHIFNDNFFSFSYLYPISMPLCFKFFFNPYINIRFSIHIHTRHCLCMHYAYMDRAWTTKQFWRRKWRRFYSIAVPCILKTRDTERKFSNVWLTKIELNPSVRIYIYFLK